MGNISYLRGAELGPDRIRAEIGEHAEGKLAFTRLAEHLDRNGVD